MLVIVRSVFFYEAEGIMLLYVFIVKRAGNSNLTTFVDDAHQQRKWSAKALIIIVAPKRFLKLSIFPPYPFCPPPFQRAMTQTLTDRSEQNLLLLDARVNVVFSASTQLQTVNRKNYLFYLVPSD